MELSLRHGGCDGDYGGKDVDGGEMEHEDCHLMENFDNDVGTKPQFQMHTLIISTTLNYKSFDTFNKM